MNQLAAGILVTLLLLTTASSAKATQGATTPASRRALEGYRLGEIQVSGAKSIPSEVIRQSLGLVSGEIYDESKLRTGFEELTRFYGEGGYIKFLPQPVLDVDEQRKVVNLTVNIDEGVRYFLNRISFTGNTTIPDEVIRREIRLTEGFAINTRLLEASRVRLNQLGLFEDIKPEDFQLMPSPDEPKVDVVLRVKEKRR